MLKALIFYRLRVSADQFCTVNSANYNIGTFLALWQIGDGMIFAETFDDSLIYILPFHFFMLA
jgi:hypothetical protein